MPRPMRRAPRLLLGFFRWRLGGDGGACHERHGCDTQARAASGRARVSSAEEVPLRHRPHVAAIGAEVANDRCLEPAVHQTILATVVLPALPVAPIDAVPERVPGVEV